MADVIWEEDLERVAEELGLEHENWGRLQSYVSLVRSYPADDSDPSEYIRENLEKWIEDEAEVYYGEHESPADFARYYYDNYGEYTIPDWIVVDWDKSWDKNLRHDFHFEYIADNLGYVWADIY